MIDKHKRQPVNLFPLNKKNAAIINENESIPPKDFAKNNPSNKRGIKTHTLFLKKAGVQSAINALASFGLAVNPVISIFVRIPYTRYGSTLKYCAIMKRT